MEHTTNSITVRIDWCRRQSAQANTDQEADGWRAEEDGLRDALMRGDHSHAYRLCPPEIQERYSRGFQDGTVLLHAARMERTMHATGTQDPTPQVERDDPQGDEQ
ncbi:MAG: hypothetical protein OEY12_05295 [Nitrospira sp.]|nr:hypothetical protein [Nitrospira sp.]MDH5496852.1 hypothetical protein [Nitrospira sp.]